jgi:hypothetical protein
LNSVIAVQVSVDPTGSSVALKAFQGCTELRQGGQASNLVVGSPRRTQNLEDASSLVLRQYLERDTAVSCQSPTLPEVGG